MVSVQGSLLHLIVVGVTTPDRQSLFRDRRGAVSLEYVVLLGSMGLVLAFALVAVGPGLVRSFQATRSIIASPFP